MAGCPLRYRPTQWACHAGHVTPGRACHTGPGMSHWAETQGYPLPSFLARARFLLRLQGFLPVRRPNSLYPGACLMPLRLPFSLWCLFCTVLVPVVGRDAWCLTASAQEQPSQAHMVAVTGDEGVTILEGIRPVLTYQRTAKSQGGRWPRANYVHPLYDLDGEVVTEDFPVDHGHHRGVFWAWHQVLVGEQALGDAWACVDFEWDVQDVQVTCADHQATLQTRTQWKSPALRDSAGRPLPCVEERATIVVHRAQEQLRWIDFSIELLALLDDVRLGGSDDSKGYGGFSPRVKLFEETRFLGTAGAIAPQTDAVSAGPWLNVANARGGMLILTHQNNPGFPQPWILRERRSMQNAVYPGRQPVPLSTTQPLRLQYRVGIYRGTLDASTIDQYQRDYQH